MSACRIWLGRGLLGVDKKGHGSKEDSQRRINRIAFIYLRHVDFCLSCSAGLGVEYYAFLGGVSLFFSCLVLIVR